MISCDQCGNEDRKQMCLSVSPGYITAMCAPCSKKVGLVLARGVEEIKKDNVLKKG